jgi:hypothetical protein
MSIEQRRAATAPPEAGQVRSMIAFYTATIRLAIAEQFQYRVAQYFYMIAM